MKTPKTLTGRMAAAFIDSKLTLLLMIAALAFGVWAVLTTPREENPQITMPTAAVQVILPGADPEEVERLVVRPVEQIINQIEGVDHVWATAVDSGALVTVQFKVGENKEESLVKLSDRIQSGKGQLPREALGPYVISADMDDVPVLAVSLVSDKYGDYGLKRIGEAVLDELSSLRDISTLSIVGGRSRELVAEIDPVKLAGYGLSITQVRAAVAAASASGGLGARTEGTLEAKIRLENFITSAEELRTLVVGKSLTGELIHLEDVARVTDGPGEKRRTASRFGFGAADPRWKGPGVHEEESVTLAVAKRKGSNAVVVTDEAIARIGRMKGRTIPSDVEVVISRNDGDKANAAVNTLIEHLGIAIVAVVTVTLGFLGWRSALIVAITIPLILALTLGIVSIAGFTINRLTLYALIIALGLLVDDSIVVIENIVRHYGLRKIESRDDRAQRSVDAAGEIGSATLLATIAVMLVFASLVPALTGMPKQYFEPVGVSVPVALAASFLIAYTVAPWAAMRGLKAEPPKKEEKKERIPGGRLGQIYSLPAGALIGHPWRERAFVVIVVLLVCAVFLMPFWQLVRPEGPAGPTPAFGVEMGFLPKDNKNTFNVSVELPLGTAVEVTDRAVRDVTELVARIPEVTNWQSWSGLSGVADFNSMMRGTMPQASHIGAVRVNFEDKKTRKRSTIEIARELREAIRPVSAKWPGSTIQVLEDPPGPPLKGTIYAEIYADDPELLRTVSDQVKAAFETTYDIAEVTQSQKADVPEYRIRIDREKAARAGVVPAIAALEFQALASDQVAGWAHLAGERNPQPIRIEIPRTKEFDPAMLSGVMIQAPAGKPVPLSSVITVEKRTANRTIEKKEGVRMTAVGGELKQTTPTYAVLDLNSRLDGMALPGGGVLRTGNLTWEDEKADLTSARAVLLWQGEMRMMLDSYRDLAKSLCLSIGSIFLILVAYYSSFGLAAIALSSVPLCFIGLIPGHWLLDVQFSASSLIGVTALSGVVVRSSLLIIDFVIDYLKEGLPLREALIDAGAIRLRPILLTTLAIVLGSVILVPDPVFGGLAITFIFGTVVSTALTIFLVPILLNFYFRDEKRVAHWRKAPEKAEAPSGAVRS